MSRRGRRPCRDEDDGVAHARVVLKVHAQVGVGREADLPARRGDDEGRARAGGGAGFQIDGAAAVRDEVGPGEGRAGADCEGRGQRRAEDVAGRGRGGRRSGGGEGREGYQVRCGDGLDDDGCSYHGDGGCRGRKEGRADGLVDGGG